MQEERRRGGREEGVLAVAMEEGTNERARMEFKNEDGKEMTQLPSLSEMKEMWLFEGFRGIESDESRTKSDERDKIFPTNPNSAKT